MWDICRIYVTFLYMICQVYVKYLQLTCRSVHTRSAVKYTCASRRPAVKYELAIRGRPVKSPMLLRKEDSLQRDAGAMPAAGGCSPVARHLKVLRRLNARRLVAIAPEHFRTYNERSRWLQTRASPPLGRAQTGPPACHSSSRPS